MNERQPKRWPDGVVPEGAHAPRVTWRTLLRDLNSLVTRACHPKAELSDHHEFARRVARDLAHINAGAWEKYHLEREKARERAVAQLVNAGGHSNVAAGRFWQPHRDR